MQPKCSSHRLGHFRRDPVQLMRRKATWSCLIGRLADWTCGITLIKLTQHYLLLQLALQGFSPVPSVLSLLPGSCCLPLQATSDEGTDQHDTLPPCSEGFHHANKRGGTRTPQQ